MSVATRAAPASRHAGWTVPLRFALRELRGGLRGFYVFLACIALGVFSISAVSAVAESVLASLNDQGQAILGGDVAATLIQRAATPEEEALLRGVGTLSVAGSMRAMAKNEAGLRALVELKGVDAAYPLAGAVTLDPDRPLAEILRAENGAYGAAADPTLLERLSLKIGDTLEIGAARVVIRATIASEPDRLTGGVTFGPRLMVSAAALQATGLIQPGSLMRWEYRLLIGSRDPQAVVDDLRKAAPDAGWELRTRLNASPRLERDIDRFTQFLTLVGLAALLVGGVGVANAVRAHLTRSRESIATLKALGATGTRVVTVHLVQVLILAAIGSVVGAALGSAMPFILAKVLATIAPLPLTPHADLGQFLLAILYGLLTALAFSLWPLGKAHDIAIGSLFRDTVSPERRWPRWRYRLATLAAGGALVAFSIGAAYDRRIAILFALGALATFVLLRLLALGVTALAARLPRPRSALARMALANLHRPGALTPAVIVSLGLGLSLIVAVTEIDANLRRQFTAALPARAPSLYFLDIPAQAGADFDAIVAREAPGGRLDRVPMLRGRIVAANRVAAEQIKPKPDAEWALQGDRGITFAADIPAGSRLVAGSWWPRDYAGPPLLSMEQRIANGLGLSVGDEVTVNVLGRSLTARIANLRAVDWQSLGINFVLVFSPGTFRGAPYADIATFTEPPGADLAAEDRLIKAVAAAWPTVSAIRVKEALETVSALVSNLVLAIRGASLVTLLAAMLVLAGALAAGHHQRVYDAVIMKTLGATRRKLLAAYALEYALLGTLAALFAVAAGSVAAGAVVTQAMNLGFVWEAGAAFLTAALAVAVTVALGLAGTARALAQAPGPVLRTL